jgi:hypothetical protein
VRQHIVGEKYFSDRRGQILFQGTVTGEAFVLVPVAVELTFGSVKPYPTQIRGSFSPVEGGTKVHATVRISDSFYMAFGLLIVALLAMFAYEIVIAPGLVVAWLVMFVPMIVLVVALALISAYIYVRRSLKLLQEAVKM